MELMEYARFNTALDNIRDPRVRAVFAYVQITSVAAVEFVVLANFVDDTNPQRYPNEIIAVPCDDVLASARGELVAPPPRNEHIYDAVMPLRATDEEGIAASLVRIDEALSTISHVWGASIRWIPKYLEAVDPTRNRKRELTPEDLADRDRLLAGLARVPPAVRQAVGRATHWMSRARQERSAVDRFLCAWLAYEGLALALYDHASEVGLPIENVDRGTRSEKQERQDARVRALLKEYSNARPSVSVQNAYFEGVVSINRRAKAVLNAAISGPEEIISRVYGKGASASQLRSDLVHLGFAPRDILARYPIDAINDTIEGVVGGLVERTVARTWQGAKLPTNRPRQWTATILPDMVISNAPGAGWVAEGDFRITHALIAQKGLL